MAVETHKKILRVTLLDYHAYIGKYVYYFNDIYKIKKYAKTFQEVTIIMKSC